MHLVGQSLKKAREEKELAIKYISENLNISREFIKKIEKDDFTDDENKVYLLGHIRSYANFLKLVRLKCLPQEDQDILLDQDKLQYICQNANLKIFARNR